MARKEKLTPSRNRIYKPFTLLIELLVLWLMLEAPMDSEMKAKKDPNKLLS
jgi:hypothetical protein